MMCNDLNLNFSISFEDLPSFIEHWAGLYRERKEDLYKKNIKKRLEEKQIFELYDWKYVQEISSAGHKKTINCNYLKPILNLNNNPENHPTHKELKERYLDGNQEGGPIWNIFFLHVLSKNPHYNKNLRVYPIFDQHVYRVMCFMQKGQLNELPESPSSPAEKNVVYDEYVKYRCFYAGIEHELREYLKTSDDCYGRKIDKALVTFGQFLKKIKPYQRTD